MRVVSFPGVGHSHPRGQKPDQPDADHQPGQEDHCSGGPQAPMGLRKCPALFVTPTRLENTHSKHENIDRPKTPIILLILCLVHPATVHSGVHDAQTGDSGVPEEIQRQEETQGKSGGSLTQVKM